MAKYIKTEEGYKTIKEIGIFDLENALLKSGGTMTGKLILSGDPTDDLDATTKQYVDHAINSALGAIAARLAAI